MQTEAQRESQIRAAIAYQRAGGDVSGDEWAEYRSEMVRFVSIVAEEVDWDAFFVSLSNRVRRCLKRELITSFSDLLSPMSKRLKGFKQDTLCWKGCGSVTVGELIDAMKKFGVPVPTHWGN